MSWYDFYQPGTYKLYTFHQVEGQEVFQFKVNILRNLFILFCPVFKLFEKFLQFTPKFT